MGRQHESAFEREDRPQGGGYSALPVFNPLRRNAIARRGRWISYQSSRAPEIEGWIVSGRTWSRATWWLAAASATYAGIIVLPVEVVSRYGGIAVAVAKR